MNARFMISHFRFLLLAVVGMALASCEMFNRTTPEYQLSDLQGLWLENGDATIGHYVRFTADQSDETGYFWGCEWTESEDVHEEDLVFHGNGWFKYSFKSALKELLSPVVPVDDTQYTNPLVFSTILDILSLEGVR